MKSIDDREKEFMDFITRHINPARKAAGVSEINEEDARSSFLLLENFYLQWTKTGD